MSSPQRITGSPAPRSTAATWSARAFQASIVAASALCGISTEAIICDWPDTALRTRRRQRCLVTGHGGRRTRQPPCPPSAGSEIWERRRAGLPRSRPRCSFSCSSPASSTVHGGSPRTVTCTDGHQWTCGNAEQRTLNPCVRCSGSLRLLPIWRGGHLRTRVSPPAAPDAPGLCAAAGWLSYGDLGSRLTSRGLR